LFTWILISENGSEDDEYLWARMKNNITEEKKWSDIVRPCLAVPLGESFNLWLVNLYVANGSHDSRFVSSRLVY